MKRNPKGQSFTEYALIIGLVVIITMGVLAATGISISDLYCQAISALGGDRCQLAETELSDWNEIYGNWRYEDGVVCGEYDGRTFAENFSGDDYVINVDSVTLSQGNGYGIYFRTSDEAAVNGYNFQYDPGWGEGAFLFRKWVNGYELSPIAVKKMPNYDWHGPSRNIQIKVIGNTFTAFIDGEEVLSVSDDTYSEGGVGLRTWNGTQACFDGVSVTSP